jgi:hypothetical protein
VIERLQNYQYMTLCVCQLMQAGVSGGCLGGSVTVPIAHYISYEST